MCVCVCVYVELCVRFPEINQTTGGDAFGSLANGYGYPYPRQYPYPLTDPYTENITNV